MTNNKKLSPAAILLAISAGLGLISFFSILFSGYAAFAYVFFDFLSLGADAFLCVVLFMKRRDILMLAATAASTLISLIKLLRFFTFVNFIALGAYGYVLVLALIVCEQNLISIKLSPVEGFFKKFFFLPAAALLLTFLINFIKYISLSLVFASFADMIINSGLSVVAIYFLCSWLLDPYITAVPMGMGHVYANGSNNGTAKAYNPSASSSTGNGSAVPQGGNFIPLGKHIALTLVTCGVWFYMWIFRTTRYLNRAPGAQEYVPVKKLLLCLFVPYYYIYWFCKHARRLSDLSKQTNPNYSDQNTMYILFGIFIPVVACILMQVRINNIEVSTGAATAQPAPAYTQPAPAYTQSAPAYNQSAPAYTQPAPAYTQPAPATAQAASAAPTSAELANIEAIRSYKELLDCGIISQEEFEAKKKQILGV